jgi:hypothetical protein
VLAFQSDSQVAQALEGAPADAELLLVIREQFLREGCTQALS